MHVILGVVHEQSLYSNPQHVMFTSQCYIVIAWIYYTSINLVIRFDLKTTPFILLFFYCLFPLITIIMIFWLH